MITVPRNYGKSVLVATVSVAFLLNLSATECRSADFGHKLQSWVRNEVPTLSRDLVKADYPERIKNVFVNAIEPGLAFLDTSDVKLDEIHNELVADTTNPASLSVAQAVALQENAINLQLRLVKLLETHQLINGGITKLDPENIEVFFLRSGAYNVGSANVMSSYMTIGNNAIASFKGRYPSLFVNTITTTDGTHVDLSSSETTGQAGMAATVSQAAAAQFYPAAIPYIGMVFTAVAIWEFHKEVKSFQEESRIFHEAIAEFPSKVMTVADQFKEFKESWSKISAEYEPVLSSYRQSIKISEERIKTLLAWNVGRLTLSHTAITVAKLKEAVGSDILLPEDKRIFSTLKNQVVSTDLSKLAGYVRVLGAKVDNACKGVTGLYTGEEYINAASELSFLAEGIKERLNFSPIRDRAKSLATEFANVHMKKPNLLESIAARPCIPTAQIFPSKTIASKPEHLILPAQAFVVSTIQSRKRNLYQTSDLNPKAKAALVIELVNQGDGFCYTNVSGAGCTQQPHGSGGPVFITRFPNDSTNSGGAVLGSAGDGGYKDNGRNASNDIARASADLRNRIDSLKAGHLKHEEEFPKWREANLHAMTVSQNQQGLKLMRDGNLQKKFLALNSALLGQSQEKINSFLKGPATALSVKALHKDADIIAIAPRDYLLSQTRDDGPRLSLLDPRESDDNRELTPLARQLASETQRFVEEMDLISLRIAKAQADNARDKVFSDGSAFKRLRSTGSLCLALSNQILEERLSMSPEQAARADNAAYAGILGSKSARYYAWGYLSAPVLEDIDVIGWRDMRTHVVNTVGEFLTCNQKYKNQPEMMQTPCNVMVGTVLNRLYGVKDFGKNGTFKLANEVAKYVRSAPEWTFVGPALDQQALDDAGMLAAKGRLVITVWANPTGGPGHVNLVLPGIPSETAKFRTKDWKDLRVPRVVNFHWCVPKDGCDPANDDRTFSNDTLDRAYKKLNPKSVLIYVRDRP